MLTLKNKLRCPDCGTVIDLKLKDELDKEIICPTCKLKIKL